MRGRAIAFSDEELAFVRSHSHITRVKLHARFTEAFDRPDVTVDNIRSLCVRNGWCTRLPFSAEDDAVIRARYPHEKTEHIAKDLKRRLSSIYQRAARLGLQKTETYLASPDASRLRRDSSVGAPFRFKKGQAPVNKGKKMPGYAPGRMSETQFKPGQKGHNYHEVGAERLVDGYLYTKVNDTPKVAWTRNWTLTHVLRWTAVHCPIPDGHCLKSIDGNRLNTDPANWRLISRSLLPLLNGKVGRRQSYDTAPAELKPTLLALATLEDASAKKKRRVREAAHA